ncbi:MAG: hypothetical protein AB7S38_17720 [Vulcanimicrobiota bacterium]
MRNLVALLVALAVVGWFTRCPSEQFALTYLRADDACVLVSQLVPGCQSREVDPKLLSDHRLRLDHLAMPGADPGEPLETGVPKGVLCPLCAT